MLNRLSLIALATLLGAAPALAKDYLLVPARPDKLVVVDAAAMAVEKVIQLDDAGPLPSLPVVNADGPRLCADEQAGKHRHR